MMLRSAPESCRSEVLTLDDPQAAWLQAEPWTIHALSGDRKGAYSTKIVPWLRAHRCDYDGVVLHGLWEYLSLAVLRAIAGHVPYVVYPHGMLDPYFKRASRLKHMKKWLYWLAVQYWVLRRALRVVFTTAAERDLAGESFWLHRWNAVVIGLGADAPPQDLAACRETFYGLLPELRDRRFLLYLGRLDPKKGCDLLIQAFAAVSHEAPDLQLVMAGPDSAGWQGELQRLAVSEGIAARVLWPGMLKGEAKWGAFAASEAFLLPSHQENFGIAIVEALSCGTPALLTRPINIAEELAGDGSVLLADDTLDGIQQLLTRWLQMPAAERESMALRARNSVATRYDMRRNTSALVDLFASAGAHEAQVPAGADKA